MIYADIILPLPIDGLFTYAVPPHLTERVVRGARVIVPFGRSKTYTGVVAEVHRRKPGFDCKALLEAPDATPLLLPSQMNLWEWMADYYLSPLGEVMKAALPASLKAEEGYRPKTETWVTLATEMRSEDRLHAVLDSLKRAARQQQLLECFLSLAASEGEKDGDGGTDSNGGGFNFGFSVARDVLVNESGTTDSVMKALLDKKILVSFKREVGRLNNGGEPHRERLRLLNEAQQTAYNALLMGFLKHSVMLLHGVTSSGKTEIYMHLIQKTLDEGKQVLYLLPEIALTVQITERLRRVFGHRLGIYHSKYSDDERAELWQKQLSAAPYGVILGVRSAVFLPFRNLGLVIVDEEHETSFKQQDPAPRYHARSVAIMLAAMYGAKTLLGTATPSAESYFNATETGKYGLVELPTRYKDILLPDIRVVDIQDLHRRKMMQGPFSPQLLTAVRQALEAGEQAILFQNRRGFAPMIECKVCGWVPKCQHCDVSLTFHKTTHALTCHYCGYTYAVPTACPCCESTELRDRGFGTEKVEDLLSELIPQARIARMDLDTTRTRTAYERIIANFASGKTNLLIGTQMISKGLDFDRVSVVGILNADAMLNVPDFRAYEHAFMMMAQVSGRAGRKKRQGTVVLQTKTPDSEVIRQVVANDYAAFFRDLSEERKAFRYPPFCRLVYVFFKHRYDSVAEYGAQQFGIALRKMFGDRVLGPEKPAVARVKTLHIRKIMLKLEHGIDLREVRYRLRQLQSELLKDKRFATLQIYFDVDPLS
ncbi:MAG: primosomal protein N' [Prevotella sp.]|nr:primosomal protein N' [Prevotella sp.]